MKKTFNKIVRDTLMKKGVYSRTSLTMFSAWFLAYVMASVDFFYNGLRYDVWLTLVGVALGSKLTDSISKKIHNEN